MRILQISSAKNFGGGERHLVDLCRGLTERGHKVFVVLRPSNNWQSNLDFLPKENFFHVSLRNSMDIFSARRIAGFIRENNIEIIHSHVARDYSIAALASFLSKTPLILTRHLTFQLNLLHRLILRQVRRIIAVSNGVAESLLSNRVISPEKISIIHNGVDVEAFATAVQSNKKNTDDKAKLLVATIGELREHKGQADFINAVAIVAKKHLNAKFLIVGQDNSKNQNYRIFLEELVKKLDLEDKIIFTGWQEEMNKFYANLDIFVSSAKSEPFGLVIAEAMASGKAIVATETVGGKELLQNNETGKLVPVGNIEELAKAIDELLTDENLRQTLGKKAQIAAKENFSLERMITDTEKVYQKII